MATSPREWVGCREPSPRASIASAGNRADSFKGASHLLALVDYIHPNPVRAGLVEAQQLSGYRWSSLFEFPRIRSRPGWLDASWTDYADGLSDTRSGWNHYRAALAQRGVSYPGESEALNRQMNRGWCIGSKSFKKACSFDLLRQPEVIRLEGDELREFNQMG